MSKLKIAFFTDMIVRDYDGCMRTIFHILDRKPEDVEIKIYTGSHASNEAPVNALEVPSIPIPFNASYKMALPYFNLKELNRSLRDFKPDVIHISSPSALGNYAVNYANKNNIKATSIYHTHYISYVEYYLREMKALIPITKTAIANSLQSFYNKCDQVFVPTVSIMHELKALGIKEELMSIWARGIDKQVFNPTKKESNLLKDLTGNNKYNLLFASRLVWEKNLETLINIYKLIQEEDLPFNIVIGGKGVALQHLKTTMPKAFFLGNLSQTELANYYASSDAFIFPSISETYGNVVTEAMACGLPCIIANGGGTINFVQNGLNGYIVNPNNANEYLEKATILVQNKKLANKMSFEALKFTAHMDWNNLVDDFYQSLKKLAIQQHKKAA